MKVFTRGGAQTNIEVINFCSQSTSGSRNVCKGFYTIVSRIGHFISHLYKYTGRHCLDVLKKIPDLDIRLDPQTYVMHGTEGVWASGRTAKVCSIRLPLHAFLWVFGSCKVEPWQGGEFLKWLFTLVVYLNILSSALNTHTHKKVLVWTVNPRGKTVAHDSGREYFLPLTFHIYRRTWKPERLGNKADLLGGWLRWCRQAVLVSSCAQTPPSGRKCS